MRLALGVVFALLSSVAVSAAEFSSLEERMSQSEFHATGLDKLSADDLKALNEWLRTHGGSAPVYVTQSGAPLFYPKDSEREIIETTIEGKFYGWTGHSVFRMENGQEWTQAESGVFNNGTYTNPKVRIKPMLVGAWLLYIEPCGCSVRVNRTK